MKFSRTFNVVRRLENTDLNVSGILCILNRACDEVIEAEEYLVKRSHCDDIESRAVYSITDSKLDHGYYILVDDDAFVVAMGIKNDDDPHHYHMFNEQDHCETKNHLSMKEPTRRSFEMFRISDSGDLGRDVLGAFGISKHGSYRVIKNENVPVSFSYRNGQIVVSQ